MEHPQPGQVAIIRSPWKPNPRQVLQTSGGQTSITSVPDQSDSDAGSRVAGRATLQLGASLPWKLIRTGLLCHQARHIAMLQFEAPLMGRSAPRLHSTIWRSALLSAPDAMPSEEG